MRCHLPWTQAFINANGLVAPCCAPLELGNLADHGVAGVFTGEPYRTLQADLAAGRQTAATRYCDNCYALRKFIESGYTFDTAHAVGPDTEATLAALESTHPDFVANYRLVREAYVNGTTLPSQARPLRLEIQLGEHCDIRCIMCWQDHAHPRGLRRETYAEIGELLPYAATVLFTGGEPTIFKAFWQLVERFGEVANPETRLQFLTHGQHLKEHLHRFEGIRRIGFCVNVDGPTRETYEKIRAGASWEKLNESLAAVAEACTTHPHWGLNTTFLLMKSNIALIDESIAFANRYNAQWSCGMIAGEYAPVAQCRTYFTENIFRFSHLGYSVDDIVRLLEVSMPQAIDNGTVARASLEATMQQVRTTQQLQVSPEMAAELNALSDPHELSQRLRALVVQEAAQTRPTLEELQAALGAAEQAHGLRSAAYATAALALGQREAEEQQETAAAAHLRAGLAVCAQLDSYDPACVAEATFHLGRCLARGSDPEATAVLQDAWGRLRTILGPTHSRTAEAALELGKALNGHKRYSDAAPVLEESYRAFTRLHADQDLSSYVAVSASELGTSYLELGRKEAEAPLRKALQMYEAMWGRDSSLAIGAAQQLRRLYTAAARMADAAALLKRYPGFTSGATASHAAAPPVRRQRTTGGLYAALTRVAQGLALWRRPT